MSRTRFLLAATAALIAGAAGPAQAATRQLDVVPSETPTRIAAAGGVAVWSQFDATANAWHLVAARDGAPNEALPVPAAPKPFDVNLGRDANGRLVAVYSRCAPGCDLYELDLTTRVETHLTAISSPTRDDHDPSIFNGAIAFLRDEPVSHKSGQVLRLAPAAGGGTQALVKSNTNGIRSPALTDDRVAYIVDVKHPANGFGQQEVHIRTLAGGVVRNVYKAASGGANDAEITNLTVDAGNRHAFLWARTNNGSGMGNRIVRYAAAGGGSFTYAIGSNGYRSIGSAGGTLGIVAVKDDFANFRQHFVLSLGAPPFDAKP